MLIEVLQKDFQSFVNCVKIINPNGCVLKINKSSIECLNITKDSSSIVMFSKVNATVSGIDSEEVINIQDAFKFQSFLDANKENEFLKFEINGNYVLFKNERVKMKFILQEESLNNLPGGITKEFFDRFKPSLSCSFKRTDMQMLLKGTSFASQSDKLYFFERDGKIIAELNDREKDNISELSLVIAENLSGNMIGESIVSISSLGMVNFINDEMKFEASNIKGNSNLIFLTGETENLYVKYLLNTKTK